MKILHSTMGKLRMENGKWKMIAKSSRSEVLPKFSILNSQFSIPARRGYIFLVSVLVIGAISISTAVTLVLLGLAATQSGFSISQSAQAYENARSCVEMALRSLRSDVSYGGNGTVALSSGITCTLRSIGGSGNDNRTICAEGTTLGLTRRVQVRVAHLYPTVQISDWEEVADFTFCT